MELGIMYLQASESRAFGGFNFSCAFGAVFD